jgi:hypothetical protein
MLIDGKVLLTSENESFSKVSFAQVEEHFPGEVYGLVAGVDGTADGWVVPLDGARGPAAG